ncbi:hypothetical protein WJX72_003913 [[Myrmecia] bisecta]|uniref:Uncharacterized protein n=1 Tax=[Myrmecia] bisecta TaxID=41462 RepID=A0AAW1R6H4_9CHLO
MLGGRKAGGRLLLDTKQLNQLFKVTRPVAGGTYALQADDGNFMARCHGCYKTLNNVQDMLMTHVPPSSPVDSVPWAFFTIEPAPGTNKVYLRSDAGLYLTRCNSCINQQSLNGNFPDAPLLEPKQDASYAQWTIINLPDGKVAIQSDTGRYLSRCFGCINNAANPDQAFIHVDDYRNAPWAQWTVYSTSGPTPAVMKPTPKPTPVATIDPIVTATNTPLPTPAGTDNPDVTVGVARFQNPDSWNEQITPHPTPAPTVIASQDGAVPQASPAV